MKINFNFQKCISFSFLLAVLMIMHQPNCSASAVAANDQSRLKTSLNDDWQFTLDEPANGNWKQVDIPHTWNNEDAFDENPGYNRAVGWYRKIIDLNTNQEKIYIIKFEAANQLSEVYINGKSLVKHAGGYTAFTVDITPYLTSGRDEIMVRVDNSHNADIPPLKGDFNFYGGIYRDVWLIELNPVHFNFGDYASSGIFVTTPQVSESSASVKIEGNIKNETGSKQNLTVINRLLDAQGKIVTEQQKKLTGNSEKIIFTATFDSILSPKLWHPDHPHLYTLISEIKQNDKVLDRLSTPVGFRWFSFDADSGFYLNGERLKLMGVNRHQDYKGRGNALSNARHVADIKLAKEAGSNFLRTAHYPQDPAVLEACDRLGLLVSMEIPIDHEITDTPAFYENSIFMQREMIRQYFNHASIIIWAYMNEMLLGRNWEEDQEEIKKITDFARKMEDITRQEDASRYTMIPNHGNFELYHKAGLTEIPMIVGWNLYYGWYENDLSGLGEFLDIHHQTLPDKPAIVTEYGAGSDPQIRTQNPIRFDFSIEWQNQFLQSNLRQIMERPFVAGSAVWNLFDFGSESRNDAVPTINSKGLMTFDRQPKDAYYLLQSWLKDEPVIRIGSREWNQRIGKASESDRGISTQKVRVYGNTAEAELFINGKSLGSNKFKNHIAEWSVPFCNGRNLLQARSKADGKIIEDAALIDFIIYQPFLINKAQEFNDIYINAGSNFYFRDAINGITWQPDGPYEKGFWGFNGGEIYQPRDRGIGTDTDILGTDRDPLFQTQRVGAAEYIFDVPPGLYEIVLLFAKLNHQETAAVEESGFDVFINGKPIFEDVRLNNLYRAVEKKAEVYNDGEKLIIEFKIAKGEPVVNGIGIRKIE